MATKRDFYEILGISKNSTEADIKKAYRKLAKQYHPDLNPGDKSAEQKFKEANEAYEVLSDQSKRARYDQFGHAGAEQGGFGGGGFEGFGGFEDIFDSFFGGGFGGRSQRQNGPQKGEDLRYSIQINFTEAAFGIKKEVTLNKWSDCSTCKGSGAKAGTSKKTCSTCGGSGQRKVAKQTPFGQFVNVQTCDVCGGEGEINSDPCRECSGKGKIRKNSKIEIKIPSGIDEGQIISLRGEGEPGKKGGPSGDLYITIRIKEHELFGRQGNDVYCEMPITFAQSALGAEIEVPTIDGKVKYTIPEGTQTGALFRLRGKGIPHLRGSGRGDQYVKVIVETPTKLDEEQKEALRNFAKLVGDDAHLEGKSFFGKVKEAFGK